MKQLIVDNKTLILIVCMALGVCSYGQTISYATNAPRCGDVIMKKPLAFFSSSNEGQGVLGISVTLSLMAMKKKKQNTIMMKTLCYVVWIREWFRNFNCQMIV